MSSAHASPGVAQLAIIAEAFRGLEGTSPRFESA
jgi:hypothetical protein